jgi:RNase H-fold protein (predicted Holliday junction resolvase)
MKRVRRTRILGLDVRSRRIGYAAFEPPARLVDFGVTRFKSEEAAAIRLASLLLTVQPGALILRKISSTSSRNCPGTLAIQRLIRRLARRSSIRVAFVSERRLRACFNAEGVSTRYQVASFLSQKYPELAWKLPRPRKPWETEYRNMSIFDAAAIGMTYLGLYVGAARTKRG